MPKLSPPIEEIILSAHNNNKTVICEVEKRNNVKYYKIKCNLCENIKICNAYNFTGCQICYQNNYFLITENYKQDFIIKAKTIHQDKFNYDLVEYVNRRTKVKILCNTCNNIFLQVPSGHLLGYGCSICYHSKIRCSIEDFIIKAIKIHNDKFNYDLVEYVNSSTKINIKCNTCSNVFEQTPNDHLSGYGCKVCADNILRSNTEDFINKAKKIHNDKFNYDLVEYIKSSLKVKISCNTCSNVFKQIPSVHLSGKGCPECNTRYNRLNTEDFIIKAKTIHQDKFNYDLVEYKTFKSKIKIICNKCLNVFEQRVDHHLRGNGCPACRESKGELRVAKYLNEKNIAFNRERTFDGLRYIMPLRFDFYLSYINRMIEFDGIGHYKAIYGSTNEEKLENLINTQRNDQIKNDWAKANNIPLLRIPYWDFDKIEELIEAFISESNENQQDPQLSLEM